MKVIAAIGLFLCVGLMGCEQKKTPREETNAESTSVSTTKQTVEVEQEEVAESNSVADTTIIDDLKNDIESSSKKLDQLLNDL